MTEPEIDARRRAAEIRRAVADNPTLTLTAIVRILAERGVRTTKANLSAVRARISPGIPYRRRQPTDAERAVASSPVDPTTAAICRRIDWLIRQDGRSQTAIGRSCEPPIAQNQISRIVLGRQQYVSVAVVARLLRAMNCSWADLDNLQEDAPGR